MSGARVQVQAPLPTQLPAQAPWEAAEDGSRTWVPAIHRESLTSSWLLAGGLLGSARPQWGRGGVSVQRAQQQVQDQEPHSSRSTELATPTTPVATVKRCPRVDPGPATPPHPRLLDTPRPGAARGAQHKSFWNSGQGRPTGWALLSGGQLGGDWAQPWRGGGSPVPPTRGRDLGTHKHPCAHTAEGRPQQRAHTSPRAQFPTSGSGDPSGLTAASRARDGEGAGLTASWGQGAMLHLCQLPCLLVIGRHLLSRRSD